MALGATLSTLAFTVGVTVDEPSHLLSAYLYWQGEDRLQPGDMPPLIKLVGGWVPHYTGLRLPARSDKVWKAAQEWNIALEMMYGLSATEIRTVFGWSRLPMIVFPLGCCLLLWWWGRQLFSPRSAVLVAAAFSLSPITLGHGALFKNDLAAAFAFLLFWYRAWVFWRDPRPVQAAALGFGVLLAILAKLSMLILPPVAILIVLLRSLRLGRFRMRSALLGLALVVLVPYMGAKLAWQPMFDRVLPHEFDAWESQWGIPSWVVDIASISSLAGLPAQLIRGAVSLVHSNSHGTGVYLLGSVYPLGHPAYFLVALAVKLPIALQLMILSAMVFLVYELARGRFHWHDSFWLAPPFLYIGLASMSNLQLGVRLVLPSVVFLILISGKALDYAWRSRLRTLVPAVIFLWMIERAGSSYPHYLAFFNQWVGGSDNGLAVLSDSNLDWGQDIPLLAEYVDKKGVPKIRLAYFGTDNPFAYLTDKQLEIVAPPWSDEHVSADRFRPEPGYYAISATLLTGQLFEEKYRDYFACFRTRKPIAKAGYSIWIYRVPQEPASIPWAQR